MPPGLRTHDGMSVGTGDCFGVRIIFCPNFVKCAQKVLCDKLSPSKFSAAVGYSSTLTKYNTKLQETVSWFCTLYTLCLLRHNKLLFMFSLPKKHNFINLQKPKLLCPSFRQTNTVGGALAPPAPTPLVGWSLGRVPVSVELISPNFLRPFSHVAVPS